LRRRVRVRIVFPEDEPTFLVTPNQLEPLSPAEERELYERLLKQCGPEDEERDIRDALPEPFE